MSRNEQAHLSRKITLLKPSYVRNDPKPSYVRNDPRFHATFCLGAAPAGNRAVERKLPAHREQHGEKNVKSLCNLYAERRLLSESLLFCYLAHDFSYSPREIRLNRVVTDTSSTAGNEVHLKILSGASSCVNPRPRGRFQPHPHPVASWCRRAHRKS